MSDAVYKNLKVSREGIVLIKSFEGFRPRAIQRTEGGWIIGYGHTLSAREGATVSEADAELLLRYDLLPVEKSVNTTVPGNLNQHQFDALVSFAFSVGLDRFASSDVLQRLSAGAPGEAADAIMGWPEPALPETALRRRAAERALFVANPLAPVALSDLLSAPLPPPPVPVATEVVADEGEVATEVETTHGVTGADAVVVASIVQEPVAIATPVIDEAVADETVVEDAAIAPVFDAEAASEDHAPVDSRGAAVAALLGERAERIVQAETIIPVFGLAAGAAAPVGDTTPEPKPEVVETSETAVAEPDAAKPVDLQPEVAAEVVNEEPAADIAPVADEVPASDVRAEDPVLLIETPVEEAYDAFSTPATQGIARHTDQSTARYLPYTMPMIGRLPGGQTAANVNIPEPTVHDTPVEGAAPVEATDVEPLALVSHDPASGTVAPLHAERSTDNDVEPLVYRPAAEFSPTDAFALSSGDDLILTPLDNAPEPALSRPAWTEEERQADEGSDGNLFGEDLTLTRGGSILRHDMDVEAPARFDWKETGPFIFMGGVGLVSFGASMAAFRRAAEQSGGGDLTIIGWVLALIGLGCVGVSSVNLYRKFGLPGGD